jgi:ABC-type Fe3+-hydroxamate transport system substrate-binding protein
MRNSAVFLLVVALAVAGCRKETTSGSHADLVSVTGMVSSVKEREVQVTTDDGRVLDFPVDDAVAVTLGGGESRPAVITEGAPVRVSYRPRGGGVDLVSIDVEPAGAEPSVGTRAQPPARPQRTPQAPRESKPVR